MQLKAKIESILFVANEPLTIAEIARVTGATELEVDHDLHELAEDCRAQGRGIQLIPIAGGWQLCTKPELAEMVANFLKPQRQRLSRAQLEVLAVVAYRQPVTASEIEAIRGVQSDHGLRGLLDRRLIQELGRKQAPGRPLLYGTTEQFLHAFGMQGLTQLPPLELPVESATPA